MAQKKTTKGTQALIDIFEKDAREDAERLHRVHSDPAWGVGLLGMARENGSAEDWRERQEAIAWQRAHVVPTISTLFPHPHESTDERRARSLIEFLETCRYIVGDPLSSRDTKAHAKRQVDAAWKVLAKTDAMTTSRMAFLRGVDHAARWSAEKHGLHLRKLGMLSPQEAVAFKVWEDPDLRERLCAPELGATIHNLVAAWLDDGPGLRAAKAPRKWKLAVDAWEAISGQRVTPIAMKRQWERATKTKKRQHGKF